MFPHLVLGGDIFIIFIKKIIMTKILISENQFKDVLLKYIKKSFGNEIVDVYFQGNMIEVILPGEESFKRENKIKMEMYHEIKNVFGKGFPIQVHFEERFYGNVEFDGDDDSGYEVSFTKEMDNGEMFEMTGRLVGINTGGDIDFEFEPYDVSNEDYYSDNWEMIENFILNKFNNR